MRYNGEVLMLCSTEEAKQYAEAVNKPLPEFREHLTLMVEDTTMVIMKNIGYGQYQIESVHIDMRSKK